MATMDSWIYDPTHQMYYHAPSATYAIPDPRTGQWSYAPASAFHHTQQAESSSMAQKKASNEKEEGEMDDDVGWGGLMEPEQIEAAVRAKPSAGPSAGNSHKHPAYGSNQYDDSAKYAYSTRRFPEPEVEKVIPEHILRLVVLESTTLQQGDVAVIDAREGGVRLGRDRCEKGGGVRVRVKEMEVSKTHGVVYWGKGTGEEEGWWMVDLGSTHGTFVTPQIGSGDTPAEDGVATTRLSEPKSSSKPHPLTHLSTIRLGRTTFTAHIHPSWPCSDCQIRADNQIPLDDGTAPVEVLAEPPAEVRYAMDSKERRENREVKRKREMAALRESLLNGGDEGNAESTPERRYVDRSAQRRKLFPQSPPRQTRRSASPARVQTTPAEPAPMSTFAQNMLTSSGWTPGAGLGRNGDGRAEPINVEARTEKRGLGATGSIAVVDVGPGDWKERGKARRWGEMHSQG